MKARNIFRVIDENDRRFGVLIRTVLVEMLEAPQTSWPADAGHMPLLPLLLLRDVHSIVFFFPPASVLLQLAGDALPKDTTLALAYLLALPQV